MREIREKRSENRDGNLTREKVRVQYRVRDTESGQRRMKDMGAYVSNGMFILLPSTRQSV